MTLENNYPEIIIECANSHSGNKAVLQQIIKECAAFDYPNKAIKFQIFSPEGLALPDFPWFEVYQKITFDKVFWQATIADAQKTVAKVWLDIFDIYGIEALQENIELIYGIKIQASVLENYEVREALKQLDLRNLKLMLNVSGFDIDQIKQITKEFDCYAFKEVIIQVGYQSYPTKIADTALQKIDVIKSLMPNNICFADHLDANDDFSVDIPMLAIAKGCNYIEKHICIDRPNTQYDPYSSLEPKQFFTLFEKVKKLVTASQGLFIGVTEQQYLAKSVQVPISSKIINAGSLIGLSDIKFRRTGQSGLTYKQIQAMQSECKILTKEVTLNETITEQHFRRAKVGVIVAGRLKSSRLKRKAVLAIDGVPSIERCLENCLKMPAQEVVVLATSTLDEDAELSNYTLGGRAEFFRGEPDDVISRYLGAVKKYSLDIVIRMTADNPVPSTEIAEYLLKSHFLSGADFTVANKCAVGTGCEIINVAALQKVKAYFGNAEYSEYMTWYFKNNPEFFKINVVDLPEDLVRDYRLTLDYEQDLAMFEAVFKELASKNMEASLLNIFLVLDQNPKIAEINSGVTIKYKTDSALIDLLNKKTKMH
jgi:N,N'-diacetyllegionaminate synthase